MKIRLLLLILLTLELSYSQNTLGLLLNSNDAFDGYTLFTPEESNLVFLIDNCGNMINSWDFGSTPKLTCYLLENGNLLRTGSNGIEIRDWDSNLIWQYDLLSNLGLRQHHDIEPLPNGNILCLVKDILTEAEQIQLGKNPSLLNGNFKSEKIIEIQPVGNNDINIVWEWRFVDHLIQDYDDQLDNYGNIEIHPELVDFNYNENGFNHSDWLHMNSISYNPSLDQIMLSSRTLGEIYIIDHSTTTLESSGHTGGNQGIGGDFLWRWGNPQVYRQGNASDQKLFKQHDAKWITSGFDIENKISVFNNGGDNGQDNYSSIHIINPQFNANNTYQLENNKFLPLDYFWSWNGEILGDVVYEFKKSGVQALENGHMLICETSKGRLSEISIEGEVVWIYRNPVGETVYHQFETDLDILGSNSMFRGAKYSRDYAGFDGKDLTPQGIIEDVNTLSENCNTQLSVTDYALTKPKITFNNPIFNNTILFHQEQQQTNISIFNVLGQTKLKVKNFSGKKLSIKNLKPGIYLIEIENEGNEQLKKIIVK